MNIKLNSPLGCEDEIVTLSNEGENQNYVDVSFVMEGAATSFCVSLDELASAVAAFTDYRKRGYERDNLMKD